VNSVDDADLKQSGHIDRCRATPVMVSRSADVVRGPVFWFFLSAGHLSVNRRAIGADIGLSVCLIGSQLAFLMAAWARIEAYHCHTGVVGMSDHYGRQGPNRIRRCIYFSSAPAPVGRNPCCVLSMATGKDISEHTIPGRGGGRPRRLHFFNPMVHCANRLKCLHQPGYTRTAQVVSAGGQEQHMAGRRRGPDSTAIWEGFFYPYLLVYLVGGYGIKRRHGSGSPVALSAMDGSVSILVLLYSAYAADLDALLSACHISRSYRVR
jgi:hypothetical protein